MIIRQYIHSSAMLLPNCRINTAMKLKIVKLEDVPILKYANDTDVGLDLHVSERRLLS